MPKLRHSKRLMQRGFTLIEIMLVIGIMTFLAIVVMQYSNHVIRQQTVDKAAADMKQWFAAGIQYYEDNGGEMPASTSSLPQLLIQKGYMTQSSLRTPFHNDVPYALVYDPKANNLVVSVQANNAVDAKAVSALLPNSVLSKNTVVSKINLSPYASGSKIIKGIYSAHDGSIIKRPTCREQYTPKIFMSASHMGGEKGTAIVGYYPAAMMVSQGWKIQLTAITKAGYVQDQTFSGGKFYYNNITVITACVAEPKDSKENQFSEYL